MITTNENSPIQVVDNPPFAERQAQTYNMFGVSKRLPYGGTSAIMHFEYQA
jgi:hypothetical protein